VSGEGEKELRIDRMCKRLGVTKGSFYHHFSNRLAFLEAIVGFWEELYTSQYIALSEEGGTAEEKLQRLLDLVVETFGPEELKLRSWGVEEPLVGEALRRVDERRLHYLAGLGGELLGSEREGQRLARLLYTTLLGTECLFSLFNQVDLREMFAFVVDTAKARVSELHPAKEGEKR
jgi:AcrR family transcriptional regulator